MTTAELRAAHRPKARPKTKAAMKRVLDADIERLSHESLEAELARREARRQAEREAQLRRQLNEWSKTIEALRPQINATGNIPAPTTTISGNVWENNSVTAVSPRVFGSYAAADTYSKIVLAQQLRDMGIISGEISGTGYASTPGKVVWHDPSTWVDTPGDATSNSSEPDDSG